MDITAQDIERAFERFDGTRVAPLREVAAAPLPPEAWGAVLAHLPGAQEISASWIVKAMAEAGNAPDDVLEQALGSLADLTEADAILHILQTAQHAPPDLARTLRPAMIPLYRHPRILVRVWAFDAYCRGADLPQDLPDIQERIRQGLGNRSKAMQARSRALARVFDVDLSSQT